MLDPAGGPRATLSLTPDAYRLPSRPSTAPPSVIDCHRQTSFILASELGLFERTVNAQLQDLSARRKTLAVRDAAALSYWSRTLTHLCDCCGLLVVGAYGSCFPLLRASIDCIAAQLALREDKYEGYEGWFGHAITKEGTATAIDLGRYRAGGAINADPGLDLIYRAVSALAMPHFGTTLWLSAPSADPQKASISFLETSFHLGWAEVIVGWLLELSVTQARVTGVPDADALSAEVETTIGAHRRCRIREQDGRWLIENFRRNNRGQPRAVILG